MINELAKIIEKLEVPRSDPAARGLQQLGLDFYRNNEMNKLKDKVLPWYSEVERHNTRTIVLTESKAETELHSRIRRNATQEYEAVSYLFVACICSHDNDYPVAIKAATDALAIFRQTSREASFNVGLALWFRGILYRLANDNRSAVDDFKEAMDILDERVRDFELQRDYKKVSYFLELRTQIAARVPHERFTEIIGQLIIPVDDSNLYDWWVAICKMEQADLKFINSYIDDLKDILALETQESFLATPFDIIFLTHCYNLGFYEGPLEYQEFALSTATEELNDYIGNMDKYNQSISHVYIAFLYYNIFDVSNGLLHLKKAYDLLGRLLKENNDIDIKYLQINLPGWISQFETEVKGRYSEVPKDQETQHQRIGLREKVSTTIAAVKSLLDTTSAPEETPPAPNKVYGSNLPSIPKLKNKITERPQREVQPVTLRKSTATDPKDPNVRLLVVPVDLRALENQAISNTLVTQHDIDNLEKYDEEYAKQKGQTQSSSRPASPYSKRFPPFPIYGNVSAGPNGEAILLTPDGFSEGIDDKLVLINNLKYLVDFIASPVPDFLHNKKYGWLKVTGESMNEATPIPLLPNDFVLFFENRSLEACVQKIVIALVADMESQPPRPMVKWLLKMSGKVPCGADGYSPEECKFLLRSQSSLVKDPITGKNFKKDIEIENDYQLVGEVIAVAKRQ